jgi:hypothetical protein
MMYSNILSKEELEALLTPEELEVFRDEQQGTVKHELMLSPAHLLLALRELEDTVGRLTARVEQLEEQLALKPLLLEPEILQVVNKVIETALFEMPIVGLEAGTDVTELVDDQAITENPEESQPEELLELQTEIQAEPYIEPESEPYIEYHKELKTEELEELDELEEKDEVSEDDERSMLLASDTDTNAEGIYQIGQVDEINELDQFVEVDQISEAAAHSISPQESSLISRSARHRERKPSFMSRLLK